MNASGVWIELYDLSDGDHDAWRSWYDDTYLRARLAVPGVAAARRGQGIVDRIPQPVPAAAPLEIALYDLDDLSPLTRDAWRRVGRDTEANAHQSVMARGSGAAYRQLSSSVTPYQPAKAEILHGAFFEVPAPYQDEFNAWYDLEHVPEQLRVGGYLNARRFQGIVDPDRFVALYDVTTLEATESGIASAAMSSPWGDRVRHRLVKSRARRLFRVDCVQVGVDRSISTAESR